MIYFTTILPGTSTRKIITSFSTSLFSHTLWFTLNYCRLPPPSELYLSTANFVSRGLTFRWSPVASDCPAIHYYIQTSHCGICPTTTNHTSVSCTDVPIDGSACIFAVQTVVCGNLVSNLSDPINTTTLLERRNTDTCTCTNTAYVVVTSSLAVALITSVVVFVTTIVVILRRSNANIKAALDLYNR